MHQARVARVLAYLPYLLLRAIVRVTRPEGFVQLTLYLAGVDVQRVRVGR